MGDQIGDHIGLWGDLAVVEQLCQHHRQQRIIWGLQLRMGRAFDPALQIGERHPP